MIRRKKTKKIGRNQRPCICGKDIKYKKCCGKNNNGWTEMDFVVPIKETPSQSPKRPYLTKSVIEDLRNITECICEDIGDDLFWSAFKSKTNYETFLVGEYGIVRLGIKQTPSSPKPYIHLGSIEIMEKHRGKGIGKRWIKSIIKITKSYGYGLVLKVSCLDYDENNYMVNKIFRESVCKSLVGIDRENTEALLNDSIYRYENTSPKQRDYLYKKNTERLLDYYANLGFIPLTIVGKNLLTFNESFMEDEGFWIYEGGLLSRSVKKTFKNYNKPKLKQ
jgi:GNAT superfamily N-acetyltransferase